MTLWEFTRLLAINVFSKLLKKLFFPKIRLCPKFKNEKRIVSVIPAFQQFLCECLQPVFYSLHLSFIDCLSGIVEYFNFEYWLWQHGILQKNWILQKNHQIWFSFCVTFSLIYIPITSSVQIKTRQKWWSLSRCDPGGKKSLKGLQKAAALARSEPHLDFILRLFCPHFQFV